MNSFILILEISSQISIFYLLYGNMRLEVCLDFLQLAPSCTYSILYYIKLNYHFNMLLFQFMTV